MLHSVDCERSEPQYVGYGPPPSVVIAVLCLVVTLTCCLCGIASICSVFFPSKAQKQRKTAIVAQRNRKSQKPA